MRTISVQEIEADPVAFVRRLEAGEEVLIVRGERTLAKVHPVISTPRELRPYGLCAGEFVVPPDFDEPLPGDILLTFEGR